MIAWCKKLKKGPTMRKIKLSSHFFKLLKPIIFINRPADADLKSVLIQSSLAGTDLQLRDLPVLFR
jgi:hypothetical protein